MGVFSRYRVLMLMMAGAVAIPYASSSPTGKKAIEAVSSFGKSSNKDEKKDSTQPAMANIPPARNDWVVASAQAAHPSQREVSPLEGAAPVTLEEAFNYDVTSGWILQRWPRVSTGLSEIDLQGYRVPLVTGTSESDLAGSLTYYFTKNQKLDRIIFHGTSGDPRNLVAIVTQRYELKRQKTDDPSVMLYQRKWSGKVLSELRIRTARVVRADQPRTRYEIAMALKKP